MFALWLLPLLPLITGECESEDSLAMSCFDTPGVCAGKEMYINDTLNCTTNETSVEKKRSFFWCRRDDVGYPECVALVNRSIEICGPEIYEKFECGVDLEGRAVCVYEKYFFWKMYPFIYIVLGVVMMFTGIGCHINKMCKARNGKEEEDEEGDYVKTGKLDGEI